MFTQANAKHSFNCPTPASENTSGTGPAWVSLPVWGFDAIKVNQKKYEGIYTFGSLLQPHG